MRIGILGSGLMGAKLGTIFARAGHEVVFSYSHSERKLERLAREARGKARAGTPREAALASDVLLLAVPWSRVSDVLKKAGDLTGKVVVSCVIEEKMKPNGSAAETLAVNVRPARFVAAFGTIPSEVLFDVFRTRRRGGKKPSLVYYGEDRKAKNVAKQLIADVGFEPIDAGPLRIGRYAEPFTMLIARLAYEIGRGPELSYRFDWHGKR